MNYIYQVTWKELNPLSVNPTKLPTNCSSVLDHFVELAPYWSTPLSGKAHYSLIRFAQTKINFCSTTGYGEEKQNVFCWYQFLHLFARACVLTD